MVATTFPSSIWIKRDSNSWSLDCLSSFFATHFTYLCFVGSDLHSPLSKSHHKQDQKYPLHCCTRKHSLPCRQKAGLKSSTRKLELSTTFNDNLPTVTTILGPFIVQRPPINSGHKFRLARVVALHLKKKKNNFPVCLTVSQIIKSSYLQKFAGLLPQLIVILLKQRICEFTYLFH